ncbi:hypothetical protein SteCoe_14594 [Stentor coeruleus]|uniref:Cyclin N-terminal domain-containing protein n=1 Tax=Stentor coeruleus TaxID=5963 RepID=A0A1R2C5Q0_9CILI|nr:hypothetical protein SteCoe_14594 [Stentor coeruleus]
MAEDAQVRPIKNIEHLPTRASTTRRIDTKCQAEPQNPPSFSKKSSNHFQVEDVFKSRAVSFLKNITTGSPTILAKNHSSPEPLQLIPCEGDLNIERNLEEDYEIGKVQAWVTSGGIKKSYMHCLSISEFIASTERPWINLNEYPGRIVPSPIKDQINEEFQICHPYIDPKLTLSKLANLREDLIKVWKTCCFDPVTLAIGLTCFDRLLNMNLVNKINRKLYAAVCVYLAFKFMEETHLDETKNKKKLLLDHLYYMDKHDLPSKMIFKAELSVYAYLNFSLHMKCEEIKENLEFIMTRLDQ